MKLTIPLLAAFAVGAPAGPTLETDYTQPRTFRVETETSVSLETTDFALVRDGEPVDVGGAPGVSQRETQRSVELDTVLEHADGRPTRLQRAFEELEAVGSISMGGDTRETEADCPLSGCVIEVTVDEDGATSAEVVEGDEPDDDAVLEGHGAVLALDALLPPEAVEVGDAWPLEADAIRRALGVDVRRALFPRPREGAGGDGRGRGSPGRGAGSLLAFADWEGEATLVSVDDELDGVPCAVIEVELTAGGELDDPGPGGGRGPRADGRAPSSSAPRAVLGIEYEVEIEGRVYVSLDERRPLAAELEGALMTEQRTVRERGDSTVEMSVTREGTYERSVTITTVAADEEDKGQE